MPVAWVSDDHAARNERIRAITDGRKRTSPKQTSRDTHCLPIILVGIRSPHTTFYRASQTDSVCCTILSARCTAGEPGT
jgi:hypothetical protein